MEKEKLITASSVYVNLMKAFVFLWVFQVHANLILKSITGPIINLINSQVNRVFLFCFCFSAVLNTKAREPFSEIKEVVHEFINM